VRRSLILCVVLGACGGSPTTLDVRIPSGQVELAGTLFLPPGAGPHAAVVIVHGSGPETRRNYIPLATTFARHGVAALVYDKRGTGQSTGDWQRSPFSALTDDASAAIDVLARRPEVDSTRVGIWGGSEGGWIAPAVASRSGRVAFVMVQSAPVVNAARQHIFQVEQVMLSSGATADYIRRAREYAEAQHEYAATGENWAEYARLRDSNRSTILNVLGGPETPDDWWWAWWRTTMAFDPMVAWSQVKVPVLALWGDLDRNVPVEESRMLLESALERAGNHSATLGILRHADHDLMPVGGGRAGVLLTRLLRRTPGLTPAMDQMAEWAAERGR
jgi:alpha-beta hydrolase superfamily lysophospholipase